MRIESEPVSCERLVHLFRVACKSFVVRTHRELSKEDLQLIGRFATKYAEMAKLAPNYDVANVPANGYRSLLATFLGLVQSANETNCTPQYLTDLFRRCESWFANLAKLREMEERDFKSESSYEMRDAWYDLMTSCDKTMLELTKREPFIGVELPERAKSLFAVLIKAAGIYQSKGFLEKLKCLTNLESASSGYCDAIANIKSEEMHQCMEKLDSRLLRAFCDLYSAYGLNGKAASSNRLESKTLSIKTRREWLLRVHENVVALEELPQEPSSGEPVASSDLRCRLLRSTAKVTAKVTNQDSHLFRNKVIIYIHGGAFMGPAVDCYESMYINEFARDIPGLTFLALDHPVGHDVAFPKALQCAIDFYLWLVSGDNKVKEHLGFHPEEIVLAGDSSGGNLVVSLTVALADIKESRPELRMPKGIVALFPKIHLQMQVFPSSYLSAFDMILSVFVLIRGCETYVPRGRRNSDGSWTEIKEKGPGSTWHKKERNVQLVSSPYLTPTLYEKFEGLKEVSLHLILLHRCPFLDEGLALARKWKGPLHLDVFHRVFHPFLGLGAVFPEAQDASNATTDAIRNAFL